MEDIFEGIRYTISEHAKSRYASRIMGKDDKGEVNRFIVMNEEKIKTDINKMIRYGDLIYTGTQTSSKNPKGNIIDVFLKDCWIVLADSKAKNVITLYKIDLGLDDEFNKSYISRMIEKLNEYKEIANSTKEHVDSESSTYRELIDEAELQIKEYKTMIKNLEDLCDGYRTIINNNHVLVSKANKDVADVLNTLVGKKEF